MPTQVLETEAIRNTPLCKLYEVSKGLSTGGRGDATLCGLYGRGIAAEQAPFKTLNKKGRAFRNIGNRKNIYSRVKSAFLFSVVNRK